MEVTLGKTVVVSSSRVESEIHIKTDEAKKESYCRDHYIADASAYNSVVDGMKGLQ